VFGKFWPVEYRFGVEFGWGHEYGDERGRGCTIGRNFGGKKIVKLTLWYMKNFTTEKFINGRKEIGALKGTKHKRIPFGKIRRG